MSEFPRIDPEHPLTVAARETNAYAETHGMPKTLNWLGMDVDPGEAAYLGEQRAIRAIASVTIGVAMGTKGMGPFDEQVAQAVVTTPLWQDMRLLLIACYLDGMTIGWRAHEIAEWRKERAAAKGESAP